MELSEIDNLGRPWAEAAIANAEKVGAERRKEHGIEFNEDDYLAGVMATLDGIGLYKYAPATRWILMVMSGRLVFPPADGRTGYTDAEKVRALMEKAKRIRQANMWHEPQEKLAQYPHFGPNNRNFLQVTADGMGGAYVSEVNWGRHGDEQVYEQAHFTDEAEAIACAEWLYDQDSWEKINDWSYAVYSEWKGDEE